MEGSLIDGFLKEEAAKCHACDGSGYDGMSPPGLSGPLACCCCGGWGTWEEAERRSWLE